MIAFLKSESGGTSIEYGLLTVLVALIGFFALEMLGTNLADLFSHLPQQKSSVTKP